MRNYIFNTCASKILSGSLLKTLCRPSPEEHAFIIIGFVSCDRRNHNDCFAGCVARCEQHLGHGGDHRGTDETHFENTRSSLQIASAMDNATVWIYGQYLGTNAGSLSVRRLYPGWLYHSDTLSTPKGPYSEALSKLTRSFVAQSRLLMFV